jgi:hypothetical protein
MTVTAKMYGQVPKLAFNKEIGLTADTIKVMLCTSAYVPNQDTHVYKDVSVTGEVTGTGYTAGGATLASKTVTYDAANNIVAFDAADVTWAASTLTARYAVIYDDSPASNKPLLAYVDFGADQSSNNGNFTITWDAAGVFKTTTA